VAHRWAPTVMSDLRPVNSTGEEHQPRCGWAKGDLLTSYHDREWGVPIHDDRRHFEFLVLEAAQAGLSWLTVLRRREAYRRAFCDFDLETVARYTDRDVERLLGGAEIIRNRAKIEATVANARAALELAKTAGGLAAYLWDFVGGEPLVNGWNHPKEVPAQTALSQRLSQDLRRRGFRFVGPIVCYSHLQATGLVNDHLRSCFRFQEVGQASEP
jgi:DNA-3-methyladenine glycosylase I